MTAIKAAAEALAEDSWTNIDLTLGQFGFDAGPDHDERGDKYGYLVRCLQDCGDDELTALQDYLFPGVEQGPGSDGSDGEGLWEEGMFRLFISHTHAHVAFVGALRRALEEMGIAAFVAHDQIEPTRQWQEEIEAALSSCDALAAVLTPDFVDSSWCDQEVGYGMARGVLIVPLGVGADPHGFIGKYQCMRAREDEDAQAVARRLFDLLIQHEKTAERMLPVIAMGIVKRYARSRSFDNARENFDQVKKIPKEYWTPELAEIVERAPAENTQVAYAKVGGEKMPGAASRFLDEMLDRAPADPT